MSEVHFTGKVGAKHMTFLVDEENKTFHSAYFTLVETTDGRKIHIHDDDAPIKMVEGETRYKAVKKGREFLERIKN